MRRIRKAIPNNRSSPVVAIKFINKEHAFTNSRLRPKQLQGEIAIHSNLTKHPNIIKYLGHGDDTAWIWIAMELAAGGDLFDKIEADVGIAEDIAHFYFAQLISAVTYMHSKGVAHRDIKPENILLSEDGDLKIADFGLAAVYLRDGKTRLCNTICGSPPYIAPEIVAGKKSKRSDMLEVGYAANIADIWSCGVVLFVLLVGNTPWDEPTQQSYEFNEYITTNGRTTDPLWAKLPADLQSLVRGMLTVDAQSRFTLDEVRMHPWFRRPNKHLSASGRAANPVGLATQLMEGLKIDLNAEVRPSQRASQQVPATGEADAMDIDIEPAARLSSTQPETPVGETIFDWERPARLGGAEGISASQPTYNQHVAATQVPPSTMDRMTEDPSFSQFSQTPSVPLRLTQISTKFQDIVPAHSLTRFLSSMTFAFLVPLLIEALHRLNIPARAQQLSEEEWYIRVRTADSRQQGLTGTIFVNRFDECSQEVRFAKAKGDPLEWRRFFKNVAVLCKDGVLTPD